MKTKKKPVSDKMKKVKTEVTVLEDGYVYVVVSNSFDIAARFVEVMGVYTTRALAEARRIQLFENGRRDSEIHVYLVNP